MEFNTNKNLIKRKGKSNNRLGARYNAEEMGINRVNSKNLGYTYPG